MGEMGVHSCMVYSFALPNSIPLQYCSKTDIWFQGSSKTLAEFFSKGPGKCKYFGVSWVKWSLLQLINAAIMEQKQPETLCEQMGTGRSLCALELAPAPGDLLNEWWPQCPVAHRSCRLPPVAYGTVSPSQIQSRPFPAACYFLRLLSFPKHLPSRDVHAVGQLVIFASIHVSGLICSETFLFIFGVVQGISYRLSI